MINHQIHSSGRNKSQKLIGHFLKIGHFVGYWWPSHWKCTVNLADQNGFWLAKCWNWSENGQWPAVTFSTVLPPKFCILCMEYAAQHNTTLQHTLHYSIHGVYTTHYILQYTTRSIQYTIHYKDTHTHTYINILRTFWLVTILEADDKPIK